jgi:pyruvate kinase
MRHTKIVATLGPSSESDEAIEALLDAGADVVRLNFSHGTHDSHATAYRRVREAAKRTGRTVAVLQDLSGPKIRTGRLEDGKPLPLHPGDELRIETGDFPGVPGRVSTTYPDLANAVRPGQELLLDDGHVVLRVLDTTDSSIRTTVVHGTSLGEHKGISAPGVALPSAGLTAKDADDVRFGLALGVDMVAQSFVQSGADIARLRELMTAAGHPTVPIMAKLERPEALAHLDDVLAQCDAVMVARGDLGLELPLEQVPRAQKEITRRARVRGIPVVVATQVLESMRTEPRPTRAEVSDAANAVDDGVDGIMLSGETAAGAFPVRAVETLDAIIRDAERLPPLQIEVTSALQMHAGHGRAICDAALTLACRGQADAIVAVTREGNTARVLSSLRPDSPILAATPSEQVARRLCVWRSVRPIVTEIASELDTASRQIAGALQAAGYVRAGSVVVFVSISEDLSRPRSNFLKLHRL